MANITVIDTMVRLAVFTKVLLNQMMQKQLVERLTIINKP